MGFDNLNSYDSDSTSLRGIRRDLREMTTRVEKAQDASRKTEAQMLAAFNNIATALNALATEVKGLREDLSPQLDKPAKLGQPKAGG